MMKNNRSIRFILDKLQVFRYKQNILFIIYYYINKTNKKLKNMNLLIYKIIYI